MGQKSYELLNRIPTHIFWNSLWHTAFNFSFYFYLNFFLKKYIYSLFFFSVSSNYFINLKSKNLKHFYTTQYFLNDTNHLEKDFNFLYFSKYWFFIFKSWIIISFFIYYPTNVDEKNIINQDFFDITNDFVFLEKNDFASNLFFFFKKKDLF